MDTIIDNHNNTALEKLNVLATAVFQNMFGLKELNLEIGVEFVEQLDTFQKQSENQMSTCGGVKKNKQT